MARARDYSAEYAARNTAARQAGFKSYWHRRQIDREIGVNRYIHTKTGRRQNPLFLEIEKAGSRYTPKNWRRLQAEGRAALRRRDFDEADRIAKKLGKRDTKQGPARRLFYYH